MIRGMKRSAAILVGAVLAIGSLALAQESPAPKSSVAGKGKASTATMQSKAAKSATKPAEPAQTAAPAPQVVMPDAGKIVLLLRNTLITLNDALQTGNFTVLRDKGAPSFRDANSAARLSQAFADLARSGADLSVVSVITPQLSEAPALDQEKGMLHVKGYFPSQPVQINFEVLYQSVAGHWRLFGLSVQPSAAKAEAAPPAAAAPPTTP
jgi:hypothetical protein